MFEDEVILDCSGCGEEACICPEICHECKMWLHLCICRHRKIDIHCRDCGDISAPEVTFEIIEKKQVVYLHCGGCGSDNVKPVDEIIDAAEYSKGDR